MGAGLGCAVRATAVAGKLQLIIVQADMTLRLSPGSAATPASPHMPPASTAVCRHLTTWPRSAASAARAQHVCTSISVKRLQSPVAQLSSTPAAPTQLGALLWARPSAKRSFCVLLIRQLQGLCLAAGWPRCGALHKPRSHCILACSMRGCRPAPPQGALHTAGSVLPCCAFRVAPCPAVDGPVCRRPAHGRVSAAMLNPTVHHALLQAALCAGALHIARPQLQCRA